MKCIYIVLALLLPVFSPLLLAQNQSSITQTGRASYYAEKFHGKLTANGEIFNMYDYTAAHRELPFNTMIKVTNLRNGKSVMVRINDRGPFVDDRILDLSKVAAKEIDMIEPGTDDVQIEVSGNIMANLLEVPEMIVSGNPSLIAPAIPKSAQYVSGTTYSMWGTVKYPEGFGIQVSSYNDLENATTECKSIISKGINEVFIQVGWTAGIKVYRVIIGAYRTQEHATQSIPLAINLGYQGFIKKHF